MLKGISLNSVMKNLNLINDINNILESYQIPLKLKMEDLTFTDATVSDLVKPDSLLSNAIVNYIWDSIKTEEVFHYTTKTKAESILNSGFFRLYGLSKRFEEGEIIAFCNSNNALGYLEKDNKGSPLYKSLLMDKMYYASFSKTNLNPKEANYLKNEFSSYQGVRLKLRVTAKRQDFRKIVYGSDKDQPLPLLNEISTLVEKEYQRAFILKGISRLCAFYLSSDFKLEAEYRMLFKHYPGQSICIKEDGEYKYIELPLNKENTTGYMIEVLEIQSNESLDIPNSYNITSW